MSPSKACFTVKFLKMSEKTGNMRYRSLKIAELLLSFFEIRGWKKRRKYGVIYGDFQGEKGETP